MDAVSDSEGEGEEDEASRGHFDVYSVRNREREMLRGCCYMAERGIVWLGSRTSDILFWGSNHRF